MRTSRSETTRSGRQIVVADVVGGLLIIVVGLVFVVDSFNYGIMGEGGRLAPGAMPFFSGLFLALTGLGVGVRGVFPPTGATATAESSASSRDDVDASTDSDEPGASEQDDDELDPAELQASADPDLSIGRSVLVLAAATAATWLASRIGFLVAFGLMIIGLLIFLEREAWWKATLVAIGGTAFAWFVFVQFLRIPIPQAPFF